MSVARLIFLAIVSSAMVSCGASRKEDEGPIKLHRPAPPDSRGYSGMKEISQEALPARIEKPGRLVGDWPKGAAAVSLTEHLTPVRDVLNKLARISRLNFVVADEVQGRVTSTLTGVPWSKALLAVLESLDLVAVLEGNVVRILRREDWFREKAD